MAELNKETERISAEEEYEKLLKQIRQEQQHAIELALTLEKERDTLQAIMESTDAHLAYLDPAFNFITVNSTYAEGSGHTKEELIGRNHFDLFPNPENEAIFKRVRDTGELVEYRAKPFEYEDQPWRGVTYWDWTLTPVKDASGNVIGLVLSLVDVTESIRAKQLSDALNDINATISSTLNIDEIMQMVVVDAAQAIGCETSALDTREGDEWVIRYVYKFPRESVGAHFKAEDVPFVELAAKTKEPVVINDSFTDPRVNPEVQRRYNVRSVTVLPLIIREEVFGALFFNYHAVQHTFTDLEIDFAKKLSSSVSLALENARLYESERHIADTLQKSLLVIPEKIGGIEFGYLYRSATEAAQVGGDFYDIFELEHGKVGIVIGDVSGKGIEATALTTVVKNTIKAHAYEDGTPALIMAKTNDLVRRVSSPGTFVTVIFAVLDTETGKLTYCNAGHPPAIIKRASGSVELLTKFSPIIGAFSGMHYRSGNEKLKKGDILIIYTDGIIEARCNGGFYGEERLVKFIKSLEPTPANEVPKAIFNNVMRCAGNKLTDDVAILTVSLEGERNA
ncbi:MAG: SpoIIE family protein phosphatase [Actinobacteria bacterium]|nr:SpoIIE family protein phosphatase [Actinomycetota bacterium]